ncbi:MAG: urease accessory protein UreD [Granulosicoccus sp.]
MNAAEPITTQITQIEPRQRINALGHVSSKAIQGKSGNGRDRTNSHSVLDKLYQQGSARIRFPNTGPGALHAVLLNTAGGLTGNDRIEWTADAGQQSHLCISTAACEKIYRTHGPAALQHTTLRVASKARLEWLPQESILFNGSRLNRSMDIYLEDDAQALIVESLILGRQAMQEEINRICVRDRWRIYCNERLLHAEDLYLDMHDLQSARTQCKLHQYSAISTLVLVRNESDEWYESILSRVRAYLPEHSTTIAVGASRLPSRLVVRALARDSFQLRKFLIPCIEILNDGRRIPIVWNV